MGHPPLSRPTTDTSPAVPPGSSLTAQVVRGAGWNVAGSVAQKALTLGAAIVVARLLTPADYAIAGLAMSVMGIFMTLTAQGFAQALIQQRELTSLACHSVFWAMTVAGLALSGLVIASAPWIARLYSQPALVSAMSVLALTLIVTMIGAVPNALLQRAMRFREVNVIGIIGGVLSAILGIGAAWLGYGYWALIIPGIGATLFVAVRGFWLSGYRPARVFRWNALRDLSPFGLSMLGSNLVQYFGDNGDYLIMGRFWLPADFGQYYFAFERSRQPFNLVIGQLSSVFFPAFSRIQADPERMRRAFLRGTSAICLVVFPLHVLLIGLADPLVPWIFGEQWRPAVLVFQVFAAFAFVRGIAALVPAGLLAINRAQAALAFNVFRLVVTLPALLCLGLRGADIVQTSLVLLAIWIAQAPFFIGYFYKQINLSWAESWRNVRSLVGITVLMAIVLVASRVLVEAVSWPAWALVVVCTIVPSATFALLARRQLLETLQPVRLVLDGQKQEPTS